LLSVAAGETSPAKELKKEKPRTGWNFSLLPKAFQKDPELDITVITEMTEAGKQRPPATPEKPVYYGSHSAGYQTRGEPLGQKPFPPEDVEKVLRHALSSANYLPESSGHPPSIMVIYTWGAHNVVNENAAVDEVIRNVLDRAALVGGEKFATDLAKAIKEATVIGEASAPPPPSSGGDGDMVLSAAAGLAEMSGITDPVRRFKESSPRNSSLFDQATANCYYVIASAYDYASLASPKKLLLWRTRMTVNADGVQQTQAIASMIAAAGPYLGREMLESELITRHSVPKGQVEVGAPTVVETSVPAKASEKK
jgi:hypothetical protein